MTLKLGSHEMIMVSFCKACIDFPRYIILLSDWMEWPKMFNELTGIKKNPTIIIWSDSEIEEKYHTTIHTRNVTPNHWPNLQNSQESAWKMYTEGLFYSSIVQLNKTHSTLLNRITAAVVGAGQQQPALSLTTSTQRIICLADRHKSFSNSCQMPLLSCFDSTFSNIYCTKTCMQS